MRNEVIALHNLQTEMQETALYTIV